VFPSQIVAYPAVAGAATTIGAACYYNASGNAALSDASAAGTAKFDGIVLEAVSSGYGITLLRCGIMAGFDLSNLAYGAPVYLSDTAGALAETAGSVEVIVGYVVPLSDPDRTKVLLVCADAGVSASLASILATLADHESRIYALESA
jgi:hypothetical protein